MIFFPYRSTSSKCFSTKFGIQDTKPNNTKSPPRKYNNVMTSSSNFDITRKQEVKKISKQEPVDVSNQSRKERPIFNRFAKRK